MLKQKVKYPCEQNKLVLLLTPTCGYLLKSWESRRSAVTFHDKLFWKIGGNHLRVAPSRFFLKFANVLISRFSGKWWGIPRSEKNDYCKLREKRF